MLGDIVLKALLGITLEYTEQNVTVLYIPRYWGVYVYPLFLYIYETTDKAITAASICS